MLRSMSQKARRYDKEEVQETISIEIEETNDDQASRDLKLVLLHEEDEFKDCTSTKSPQAISVYNLLSSFLLLQ